jgi:ribosomal protein S4
MFKKINNFQTIHIHKIFNYLFLLFNYLYLSKKTFFLISDQQNKCFKNYCELWSANYVLGNKKTTKGIITNLGQTLYIKRSENYFTNITKVQSNNILILFSPTNFYQFLIEEIPLYVVNQLFFFTPIYLKSKYNKNLYPIPKLYFLRIDVDMPITPELLRHLLFLGEFLLYFIILFLSKIKLKLLKSKLSLLKQTSKKNFYSLLIYVPNLNSNIRKPVFNINNKSFKESKLPFYPFKKKKPSISHHFLMNTSEGKLVTTLPRVKPKTYFYRHQWRALNPGKVLLYASLRGKRYARRYKNLLFIRANFQRLIIKFYAFRNRRLFFKYFVCRQRYPIHRFSSRINYYLVNIELQLSSIIIRLFWVPNLKVVKQLIMNGYVAVNDKIVKNPFYIIPVSSYLTLHSISLLSFSLFNYKTYFLSHFFMMHKVMKRFIYKYQYRANLLRRHKFYLYYSYKRSVYKFLRKTMLQYKVIKYKLI